MAIPKISSKELNEILENAQNKMVDISNDVNAIKEDIVSKMKIIQNEQEFAAQELMKLMQQTDNAHEENHLAGLENKIVFMNNKEIFGDYDIYGSTIHRKFIRTPLNVFNLMTLAGPLFRNNMSVTINGEKRERYKNMLMHQNCPEKDVFFEEFSEPNINIIIEVNREQKLGKTTFNTVEINPFLPGSFTINSMKVYDVFRDESKEDPEYQLSNIKNVGPGRYILDRKYELLRVEFDITINFRNSTGKYPFGLKHLYFLEADYISNSYVATKIEKDRFIESVHNNIYILDQFGKRQSTLTEEGIKLYLNNIDGVLEYELLSSTDLTHNIFGRNTREFYVHIPLPSFSILNIELSRITTR